VCGERLDETTRTRLKEITVLGNNKVPGQGEKKMPLNWHSLKKGGARPKRGGGGKEKRVTIRTWRRGLEANLRGGGAQEGAHALSGHCGV